MDFDRFYNDRDIINENYIIKKYINGGSFGQVYQVIKIDGAGESYDDGSYNPSSQANKKDDGMVEDIDINIGDINILADIPNAIANNDNTETNFQTYNQKLEAKHKEIHNLIRTTVTKLQNKLTINWTVIEESIPNQSSQLANF